MPLHADLQLQQASGDKVPTRLVLGEVVGVHIAQALLKDGVYDTGAAGHVLRGGGPADYFTVKAGNCSGCTGRPDHLVRWLRARPGRIVGVFYTQPAKNTRPSPRPLFAKEKLKQAH